METGNLYDTEFVHRLTDIVLANLENERFGVEELSRESGMSRYRLGRKLYSVNKKTINQFIREVRLQKAKEILQRDQYTAAEVAYKTGFGSATYFNKCFHKHFGYPPGKVLKGEVINQKPNDLIPGNSYEISGRTKKWIAASSFPIILVIVLVLGVAGYWVYTKTYKRERPTSFFTSDGKISIAVMPFLNMTRDSIWEIWQEGIQQNLISWFSNSKELMVRQQQNIKTLLRADGISEYASLSPDIAGIISQKLYAEKYIYGYIQKAGPKLRLNAQLIDTKTRDILQSFDVNGPYIEDQIIELSDSLRQKIASFLLISKLLKEFPEYQNIPALTTDSPKAFRYFILGNTSDNDKTAVDWYLKALEVDSNFFSPMMGLSTAYSNLGMPEENYFWVLQYYEKRKQWPIIIQLAASWAYAYSFESPEEQIKYLEQILQVDDQNPNTNHILGYTYIKLKQYDKAIPPLEKSLAIAKKWGKEYIKPQVNWFYGSLGQAYHKTGQYRKEKKLYKNADRYDPEDRWVASNRAVLALSQNDTAEANRNIQKYANVKKKRFSSSDAQVAAGIGDIYLVAGLWDRAEDYFRKAVLLEPENPGWIIYLAAALIDLNQKLNEVPELMDRAMKLVKTKTDYYNCMDMKGWSLYKQGKYAEALEILEKTWEEAPYKLYSIKFHLEEIRKAVAVLN